MAPLGLAPGPIALPVVGALPQIGMGMLAPALSAQPHRRLSELAGTYGDVMTVNFGPTPWVILSSPEAVHEAFVTKGSEFAGRPSVASMSLSAGKGKAGFGRPVPNRELRNLRRAAYSSLFSDAAVDAKRTELEAEAELLANHLLATTRSAEPLRASLRRCVSNMVLRFAFSARVPYASEKKVPSSLASEIRFQEASGLKLPRERFAELLSLTDAIWSELSATPTTVLDLLGVSADNVARRQLRVLIDRRNALLSALISERRAQHRLVPGRAGGEVPPADMLDVLLASGLPEADILYTLVDLFVAGVNTVSTTIEWQLLLTADRPLVQERARAAALR